MDWMFLYHWSAEKQQAVQHSYTSLYWGKPAWPACYMNKTENIQLGKNCQSQEGDDKAGTASWSHEAMVCEPLSLHSQNAEAQALVGIPRTPTLSPAPHRPRGNCHQHRGQGKSILGLHKSCYRVPGEETHVGQHRH